jgi:hypothetical protein
MVALPDLNFFEVEQHGDNGSMTKHFNIAVGEPDSSLSVPPAGAKIVQMSEPGGIIFAPDPVPVKEQIEQYKKQHPEAR